MSKFSIVAAIIIFGSSLYAVDLNATKPTVASSDERTIDLALISVIANRSETDIAKYAGQIGVINNISYTPSIIEALDQIPGVQIGGDYGRQIGQDFKIRGYGYGNDESRIIIKQDGIRRSVSMFSNQISSFRVDNDLLKRVEVVKGASSVLHGSGAIGGIVSMQTKGVDDYIIDNKDYGVMIGSRIESNNMHSFRGAIAIKPYENFGFLFYGKHADFGNIKLADGGNEAKTITKTINKEQINTLFTKTEWDVTDEQRLEFSLFNFNENVTTGWNSLWHYDPGDAPTIGTLKQRDYNLKYSYIPLNNNWINFEAQYYNAKSEYNRDRVGRVGTTNVNNYYINKDDRWGINLKNESIFDTGIIDHRLVIGADYEKRRENATFIVNGVLQDSSSMPNYYKDLGIYIQNIINLRNLEITVGGRYDRFERGVNINGSSEFTESRFSPRIAFAYEIFEDINLLAGYAETFRSPTPHETSASGPLNIMYWYIPNSNLKPEIAKEYEFGFSVDKSGLITNSDELYLKATYYTGEISNLINLKALTALGTPPHTSRAYAQYQNIAKTKRYGYEVEAKYNINYWLFDFSYDHTKLTDKETKARIKPFADKITLGATYSYIPWGLSGGVHISHWLKPYLDTKSVVIRGNTYYYPDRPYTIVNLRGSWVPKVQNKIFGSGFKLNFGVNNILDDKHIQANSYKNSGYVGRGRNFYIDFEKKF
ncbi:TonB-dependent receptor [Campylobacter sp. faydin G-24]|uniref:TonB-dependent receptor n=1 Tax=Campylobacter anatolicus TaxID=2829105 RepID=A0ABS5HIZ0_9BACT|nr:TonB-dependent receptor [Campylobacter anatolicus]MBR8464226.1 TonB-dependent receptor [Campylobacter anatolicus]